MIGRSLQRGILRISRIVSMPSISGIMMSISTMSMSGSVLQDADRVAAVVGRDDHHVVLLQHRGQREDVAHVVVDDQHLLAREHAVRVVQLLERLPLLLATARRRCGAGRSAVVEQPLECVRASRSANAPSPRFQARRQPSRLLAPYSTTGSWLHRPAAAPAPRARRPRPKSLDAAVDHQAVDCCRRAAAGSASSPSADQHAARRPRQARRRPRRAPRRRRHQHQQPAARRARRSSCSCVDRLVDHVARRAAAWR